MSFSAISNHQYLAVDSLQKLDDDLQLKTCQVFEWCVTPLLFSTDRVFLVWPFPFAQVEVRVLHF